MKASVRIPSAFQSLLGGVVLLVGLSGACSSSTDGIGGADDGDGDDVSDGSDLSQAGAPSDNSGSGGGSSAGVGGGASSSDDTSSDDLDVTPPPPPPPPIGGGNGETEVCDGVDNDGDGEIDNVDAGGDGICDCLVIGTIGSIGPWSDGGNVLLNWLSTRSPVPTVDLGIEELTAERLEGINVIVALRASTNELENEGEASPARAAFTEDEIADFEAWVKAGGGVMTTAGYEDDEASEVVNINNLLAPFDVGYSTTNLLLGWDIESWSPTHPIANGISYVFADNGVVVEPGSGEVVARDENNEPALVATEAGLGHVLVYGDEWITYDSEWEGNREVELLWVNMLKWLTPIRQCQVPVPPELFE